MFCSDRRYSAIISIRRRQLNFLLYGQSTELFRVGRSVCKIIIIMLSFRVGTCTNKIIDNEVKEMYYYVNTSDIWNRPHLFTSRFNNIKCTNLFFFNVFYRYLKEKDHVKQNIKSITRNVYIAIKCTKYLFLCVLSLSKRKRSY